MRQVVLGLEQRVVLEALGKQAPSAARLLLMLAVAAAAHFQQERRVGVDLAEAVLGQILVMDQMEQLILEEEVVEQGGTR